MIPKKIHYCWFGGKEKPNDVMLCINSWKRYLPDYEIVEWNENSFNIENSNQYVREAIDTYYDASNTYDIVITSTLGLTDEDIKAIQNLDKSYNVYGVNSVDKEITIKEEKFNAKFIELKSEINDIDLVSGKRQENDTECVLDSQFAKRNKYFKLILLWKRLVWAFAKW